MVYFPQVCHICFHNSFFNSYTYILTYDYNILLHKVLKQGRKKYLEGIASPPEGSFGSSSICEKMPFIGWTE